MDGRVALVLGLSIIFGVLSICKGHQYRGNLEFNDNLKLGWRINSTKGTIRFTVKALIDENGWFLIGFAPQMNNSKKISLKDISGDGFVVWKGASRQQGKGPIWRIMEIKVENGTPHSKVHQADIHLGSSSYDKSATTLTAIVWRPLKTKNDIEIKHKQLVVFGSYGNSEDGSKIFKKGKNKLKQLIGKGAVGDAFTTFEHVDFFKKASKHESDKKGIAYAAAIAEKHWIGLVVGISAFLTVIITCSVYCLTKKKKDQFKRVVNMSFHRNGDDEDEAKVAFLQSEET